MSIRENRFNENGELNRNHFSMQNISVMAIVGIAVGIIMIIASFVVTNPDYINGLRALGAIVIGTGSFRLFISVLNSVKAVSIFVASIIGLLILASIM